MGTKIFPLLGGGLMIAVALAGCGTPIEELPAEVRTGESRGAEYDLCRELLMAFLANDAAAFCRNIPAESRANFTEEQFNATRAAIVESMGEPVSFRYVTSLELTAFTPHIWKIRFKRTNPRTGEEFTSELLFKIVVGNIDGEPVLISFQFL